MRTLLFLVPAVAAIPFESSEHYPYAPFGAKPYEHHYIDPSKIKEVKKVSNDSITNVPNADDYKEAEDAVFHAVENAEKKILNIAKKAEQAAEHAIEDEVDVLFSKRHKAGSEMVQNVKQEREEVTADIADEVEKLPHD